MSEIVSENAKRAVEAVEQNQAPVLMNSMECGYAVSNKEAFVGSQINVNATSCISDPDGDALSWEVKDTVGQPHQWMQADAVTGLISGNMPAVGTYDAVAVAKDPAGLSVEQPFSVNGIPAYVEGDLILNNSTVSDKSTSAILALDNGYVVTICPSYGAQDKTSVQILDLDGKLVREIQFDATIGGGYSGSAYLKRLPNGNFVASWNGASQEFTQAGDAVGEVGAPFYIDYTVATLDNGLVAKAMEGVISNPDGSTHRTLDLQFFDSNNVAVSTKISVSPYTSDEWVGAFVTPVPGGKCIVSTVNESGMDGSKDGSFGYLFSSDLTNGKPTPLGDGVVFNARNAYNSQYSGRCAVGSDGRVLAVWTSQYGPYGNRVASTYGRVFNLSDFMVVPSPTIASPTPPPMVANPSPIPASVMSPVVSSSIMPSPSSVASPLPEPVPTPVQIASSSPSVVIQSSSPVEAESPSLSSSSSSSSTASPLPTPDIAASPFVATSAANVPPPVPTSVQITSSSPSVVIQSSSPVEAESPSLSSSSSSSSTASPLPTPDIAASPLVATSEANVPPPVPSPVKIPSSSSSMVIQSSSPVVVESPILSSSSSSSSSSSTAIPLPTPNIAASPLVATSEANVPPPAPTPVKIASSSPSMVIQSSSPVVVESPSLSSSSSSSTASPLPTPNLAGSSFVATSAANVPPPVPTPVKIASSSPSVVMQSPSPVVEDSPNLTPSKSSSNSSPFVESPSVASSQAKSPSPVPVKTPTPISSFVISSILSKSPSSASSQVSPGIMNSPSKQSSSPTLHPSPLTVQTSRQTPLYIAPTPMVVEPAYNSPSVVSEGSSVGGGLTGFSRAIRSARNVDSNQVATAAGAALVLVYAVKLGLAGYEMLSNWWNKSEEKAEPKDEILANDNKGFADKYNQAKGGKIKGWMVE
jgi:hypothetical protein